MRGYGSRWWAVGMLILTSVVTAGAQEAGGPDLGVSSLKALSALILIIALILVLAWLARRYLKFLPKGTGHANNIQVVSTRSLGPKRAVYLLEVEGRRLLVGSAESGVSLLQDFGAADSTDHSQ
jgi:flagellar biosynthetic protein FliO